MFFVAIIVKIYSCMTKKCHTINIKVLKIFFPNIFIIYN